MAAVDYSKLVLRDYIPEPTAAQFHASGAFVRGIMGPFGSGKSVACIMEALSRSYEQLPNRMGVRRSRWAFVRNTYPELLSTTLNTWLDWVPEAIAPIKRSPRLMCTLDQELPDGTRIWMEVIFLALDTEADVGKLKSLELTGAFLNEASEIPKEVLEVATSRVGRFPAKDDGGFNWTGVVMDTNPPPIGHWWQELDEKIKPERYEFFTQPPALLLKQGTGCEIDGEAIPPVYVPNTGQLPGVPPAENVKHHVLGFDYYLNMVQGKSMDWVKVYIQGQYGMVTKGKPVYPEYNDHFHCSKKPLEIVRGMPVLLGFDYGRTPACVFCQMSPTGQVRVLREYLAVGMGLQSFLPEVIRPALMRDFRGMNVMVTGDPSGNYGNEANEMTCETILRENGFNYMPAVTNKPSARIESVVKHLITNVEGKPGFQIDPSCTMLREGFASGYHYRKIKTASGIKFADAPDKNEFSHIHDALQYACLYLTGFQLQAKREAFNHGRDMVQKRTVVGRSSQGWT
jgi:hypothetical protein